MTTAIITTAVIGLLLFILSFFMNDRLKQLEDEVEQISISSLQEIYKLKRKLNILEEELLFHPDKDNDHVDSTLPLYKQVVSMEKQGYTVAQISERTTLHENDIRSILEQNNAKRISL
ncbi:hypothetical protein SAMN05421743_111154 [Thalassobacillus cyri]|uniref:Uncharacterized protein n=1 Tax=Thalassobacillus cyri TaxID=571932 RepID=A0A1H4FJ71_9BACI|nr:hypothetical protein [Thalassobacillus cyri]SEA97336.1 hypothetical protein SAMN05421743_111154 [Thalassobacillus cyri]